ncbi:hypothetical protein Goari_022894 [Gossypium aridum]|uniref:CCHC-type domain-containing protein n=1 Tax=Gossypium aridum TaxID=34290 RepID=A0A7J8YNY5_GOSAI|nr:hypothetical protein [Gossypium aridum]
MHIRVKIDVQQLLRRKKFSLPNGDSAYACFKYEKLSLFCFLCGKLGHGKSFCPLRATIPKQDVVFQWDLSLRPPPRKVAVWKSKWMMEDGNGDGTKLGNFLNMAGGIRGDPYKSFPTNHGLMEGMLSNATNNNLVSDRVVGSVGEPEIGLHVNTMVETMDEEMSDIKREDIHVHQIEGYKRPQTKALQSRPAKYNKTLKLERSGIRKTSDNGTECVTYGYIKKKDGFRDGIDVDLDGKSGSLSLGWKESYKVTLRSFSKRHINVLLEDKWEGNRKDAQDFMEP